MINLSAQASQVHNNATFPTGRSYGCYGGLVGEWKGNPIWESIRAEEAMATGKDRGNAGRRLISLYP